MRSKLITATLGSASLLFAPLGATAASDEQIRLLEQRMAEMEDRLEATSAELKEEKKQNVQQREMLESQDSSRRREGDPPRVGNFFQMVDVTTVTAASYNYRFIDGGDDDALNDDVAAAPNGGAVNDPYFTHKNADSFPSSIAVDHARQGADRREPRRLPRRSGLGRDRAAAGSSGGSADGGRDSGLLYTGYVSYRPIGQGIESTPASWRRGSGPRSCRRMSTSR
jgi:TolA-binding protein